MAQTVAAIRPSSGSRSILSRSGELRVLLFQLTISSYVNPGGEAINLATNLPSLVPSEGRVVAVSIPNQNGRMFQYDTTTKKVAAYGLTGTEVTNATNIGVVTGLALVQG